MEYSANTNRLEHSNAAISVTHKFYNAVVSVYVEGDDDYTFWNEKFQKCTQESFHMEGVGGKENLKRYIDGIKDGSLHNIFVAKDSDYGFYSEDDCQNNPYIICTYGHSIENTMFCPENITSYINRIAHNAYAVTLDETKKVCDEFAKKASDLLLYDIINNLSAYGGKDTVLAEHYGKFSNKTKGALDENKIRTFLEKRVNEIHIPQSYINGIKEKMNLDPREKRFIIQGHFYASAMMEFARDKARKSMPNDAFYATLCDCIGKCQSKCNDIQYVEKQILKAFENLKEEKEKSIN